MSSGSQQDSHRTSSRPRGLDVRPTNRTVEIQGEIAPGHALFLSGEKVQIPFALIDDHEVVFKVRTSFPEAQAGDYLICEMRNHAATAELCIAHSEKGIQVGRYWGKNGLDQLRDIEGRTMTEHPQLIGVVTLIVRGV